MFPCRTFRLFSQDMLWLCMGSMPNNLHAMFAILRLQHLMDRSVTQFTFTSRLRTSQSLYCTKAKLFIEKVVDMHFEFVRFLSK